MENTAIKHPFELVTAQIAHTMDRAGLIDWLCWNNPDGKYSDVDSMAEYKNTLSRNDALALVLRELRKIKNTK